MVMVLVLDIFSLVIQHGHGHPTCSSYMVMVMVVVLALVLARGILHGIGHGRWHHTVMVNVLAKGGGLTKCVRSWSWSCP